MNTHVTGVLLEGMKLLAAERYVFLLCIGISLWLGFVFGKERDLSIGQS